MFYIKYTEGQALKSLSEILNKPTKTDINIGISLQTDRVSVCATLLKADGRTVTHCASLQGNQGHLSLLKQLISEQSIPKGAVTLVLNVEDHKIHKLARPAVEKDELNQSVTFLLKDRLDYGMEDSVVEVIDYPPGCQLDDQIMVVESSKKKIQDQVNVISSLGLALKAIDIPELVLGDILQSYPGIDKGFALVLDHDDGATLIIYRGEHLYLIRKLSGISDFISCLPAEGNQLMADTLLLEIQRTLDYYDAQLRQPPLAGILLAPSFGDISSLVDYLDKNLATKVESLDINLLLDLPNPLSPALQQDCLTACAAAFRQEQDS